MQTYIYIRLFLNVLLVIKYTCQLPHIWHIDHVKKHPVTNWCDRILAPTFSISVVKNLIKTIQKLIWWNSTNKRFKMSPPNAWFSRFFKKKVSKRKLISSNRKCSKSFITSHIFFQKYYKDGQIFSHFNFLAFFYKLLLNISYVF